MPRYYGDNIKGSEFARLRSKVVSALMLGTVACGYLAYRYGYPTQRRALEEGWYDDTKDTIERREFMRLQLSEMPMAMRNEKGNFEATQKALEKVRAADAPLDDFAYKSKNH